MTRAALGKCAKWELCNGLLRSQSRLRIGDSRHRKARPGKPWLTYIYLYILYNYWIGIHDCDRVPPLPIQHHWLDALRLVKVLQHTTEPAKVGRQCVWLNMAKKPRCRCPWFNCLCRQGSVWYKSPQAAFRVRCTFLYFSSFISRVNIQIHDFLYLSYAPKRALICTKCYKNVIFTFKSPIIPTYTLFKRYSGQFVRRFCPSSSASVSKF